MIWKYKPCEKRRAKGKREITDSITLVLRPIKCKMRRQVFRDVSLPSGIKLRLQSSRCTIRRWQTWSIREAVKMHHCFPCCLKVCEYCWKDTNKSRALEQLSWLLKRGGYLHRHMHFKSSNWSRPGGINEAREHHFSKKKNLYYYSSLGVFLFVGAFFHCRSLWHRGPNKARTLNVLSSLPLNFMPSPHLFIIDIYELGKI